jgi:hypothetical protein
LTAPTDYVLAQDRASASQPRAALLQALSRVVRNVAVQDLIILCYHSYMLARVWLAPASEDAHTGRWMTSGLLVITLVILLLTRGELLLPGFGRSCAYRLGMFVPVVLSYLTLRTCLPALQPRLLDAQLLQIDRVLFGETPAILLDRFVTPATVEWFAFFYYAYFALIGSHLVCTLIFDHGRRQYELLLGAAIVVAVGHASYTLVPGAGPHDHCAGVFRHVLVGGAWWRRVEDAVRANGAMLDIFPSLHTALPTLMVLHGFRNRRSAPFKQIWPVVAFAVVNIVIATVFLRWHYGVDLVAGATLAFCAHRIAIWAWRHERQRSAPASTKQAVWERLAPAHMDTRDFNFVATIFVIHVGVIVLAWANAPGLG